MKRVKYGSTENLHLRFTTEWLICLIFLTGISFRADAQVTASATTAASTASDGIENVPRVPGVSTFLHGFNAGINFSAVHNSVVGWYEMATPAVSYTFTSHYSGDVSTPLYLRRPVQNLRPVPGSNQSMVLDLADPGDTLISFHAGFHPGSVGEIATFSINAPTGDRSEGLGTGRVTVDFNNHLEHYRKQVGFLLDLGIGDSSSTINNLVTRNYDSLGPLAHFQTGAVVWLFRRNYIQSVAYEQLPFGRQTVYTTITPPAGFPKPPTVPIPVPTPTLVTSSGGIEDNGFTTSVGIPLADQITLSSYYNRSLRQHQDTFSLGITYVLRGTQWPKRTSLIDRALREAAGMNANDH